jgi:sigma-B regulation protein RsbU (phosphoserine phosphatase)
VRPLSDCRILIVDDVKTNVDVLLEALRSEYRISVALSGESALKTIARTLPDLILLDIMMPGLDGYEVCRRLRADPATRDIPIVFLSALDESWNKVTAFEVGGTDYVTKPFDLLEVKARIRSLLKAKAYHDLVQEQLTGELKVAHDIQMSIVPKDFAPPTAHWPLDLFAVLEPAREVGGDLYQFFPVGQGRLCAFVGDVSGKGVPAALLMAVTNTLIRTVARDAPDPERILSRVNEELSFDNPSGMFVTLVCALVDPRAGRLSLASGGHARPVLLRRGEAPRFLIESPGTALGLVPDVEFQHVDLELQPEDTVLLYTDGVTEAFSRDGRCFTEEGLMAHLATRAAGATARETVTGVLGAVKAFSHGVAQSDDIAVLAIRYSPVADGAS